ncbi:universal stress protein [Nonomuraea sp. MG754425]|uniref:universal stress protein n=1 Tax=Nonomuraea sp. MG754425 TaxID=2570319 RepID=UPI001F2BDC7D|nr:universal stress protein [Nonomuraea sp. MG754425]
MDETLGVVVAYDGSDHAMQALDWAMDEAEFRRLPLTLCHAWQWPYGDGDQAARDSLRSAAQHVLWHGADCARASTSGLDVRPDLYEGSATDRLESLSTDAELLVVGSRGLGAVARAVVGSVAAHTAAHAHCPVIVVRGRGSVPRSSHPGPVVAGVTDDGKAEAVLAFACEEARARSVPLIVIHAWTQPPVTWGGMTVPALNPLDAQHVTENWRQAAENWLADLLLPWRKKAHVTIEARVTQPRADDALNSVSDATLMVVGCPQGRFGSVTASMLRRSPCPVAVVR